MKKLTFREKVINNAPFITLTIAVLTLLGTCKNGSKINSIQTQIDSLPTQTVIIEQIKIEGLESSKRSLYDNNAIIRTTIRPDDRMNQYDEEIKKLKAQ